MRSHIRLHCFILFNVRNFIPSTLQYDTVEIICCMTYMVQTITDAHCAFPFQRTSPQTLEVACSLRLSRRWSTINIMMKAAEPTSVLYHHNHQSIHRREGAAASSLDTDASCSFNKYVSQCRQPTMPPATVIDPVNTFRDTSKAASSLLMRATTHRRHGDPGQDRTQVADHLEVGYGSRWQGWLWRTGRSWELHWRLCRINLSMYKIISELLCMYKLKLK